MEVGAVGGRDAEELADDGDGQREGVGAHEIRAVGGAAFAGAPVDSGHVVEELGADVLDARAQTRDTACGEFAGDEGAEPGVVGRVGLEHVEADRETAVVLELGRVPDVVAQPRVGESLAHGVVPEHHPDRLAAGHLHPVHRALLAQGLVGGVGIGEKTGKCRGQLGYVLDTHSGSQPFGD